MWSKGHLLSGQKGPQHIVQWLGQKHAGGSTWVCDLLCYCDICFEKIFHFRIVKSIIEHEEMKGLFGSICEDFQERFQLKFLDISDLPKLHSTNQETIHFVTEGD